MNQGSAWAAGAAACSAGGTDELAAPDNTAQIAAAPMALASAAIPKARAGRQKRGPPKRHQRFGATIRWRDHSVILQPRRTPFFLAAAGSQRRPHATTSITSVIGRSYVTPYPGGSTGAPPRHSKSRWRPVGNSDPPTFILLENIGEIVTAGRIRAQDNPQTRARHVPFSKRGAGPSATRPILWTATGDPAGTRAIRGDRRRASPRTPAARGSRC